MRTAIATHRAPRHVCRRPSHAGLLSPALSLLLAMLGALLLAPVAAWAAEPSCAMPANTTGTSVRIGQASGRVTFQVDRAGSAGRRLQVDYNDDTFYALFNAEGHAELAFALLAPENKVTVRLSETPPIRCTVDVPDFDQFYRVVLVWRDPVQLALHVIEPGQRLGTFGHISPEKPNADRSQGIGVMDVVTGAPRDGSTGEVSYVIANPRAIPPGRFFNFRLEYLTRGETPAPPYCDDNPLATIGVQLIVIDGGKVAQRSFGTARARCGQPLSEGARFQPLRQ